MKRKQSTEEQIIGILQEAGAGTVVTKLCRRRGLSSATCYPWKTKFGGWRYRRLRSLFRRDGITIFRKKTQRLYRGEGLTVRRAKGRRRAVGARAPAPVLPDQR